MDPQHQAQPPQQQPSPMPQAGGFGGGMGGPQAAVMQAAASAAAERAASRFQNAMPLFGAWWLELKYYFEVDNKYVLSKLRTVVFSALVPNKKWRREVFENTAMDQQQHGATKKFATPIYDENAPDLYIPLMSFVTYIVLCSYIKGTNGKFTPEVLSQVMYSCLGFQFVEVLLVRIGLYFLNVPNAPLLDLMANTGYKYVGLCVNMLVGLVLGRALYTVAMLWTGFMTSYFMLKTLANNYASSTNSSPFRMPVLYSVAFLQLASIWWLGNGRELR